jgi:hypothetical protein
MLCGAVEKARVKYPNANVHIIDLDNFYRLLKHKLATPFTTPYSSSDEVSCVPEASQGLLRVIASDGSVKKKPVGQYLSWQISQQSGAGYLYFAVDAGFKANLGNQVTMTVEYFDSEPGELLLEYNSSDHDAPLAGAYKLHPARIVLTGTHEWKSKQFQIDDAAFKGRQNFLSDFRFVNLTPSPINVRKVIVQK